jgi:PAS domain-containing protein
MSLHLLGLPKLIAERRSSAVFGMVIIAMLWAGLAFKYAGDVEEDKREAQRANRNFAMVFEENVLRSIGEIDKALLYLRRTIETRQGSTDFATIANTTDVLSEIIVQVAIIDADGIMRASNAGPQPAPAVDLSDREHYRVHVGTSEDRLFISRPVVGRVSGKWSVQFSRRFSNPDHSFGGVVVASLNPEHLTQFYDKIDFGSAASIALIGTDGVIRSSGGSAGDFELGQDVKDTELFSRMQSGGNSTFEASDAVTGEGRLVTVRKVKGHPLWVSVSTNNDEIYRSSWTALEFNALAALVLTVLLLAAMERVLRTEARARLKAEQLRLTLENMSQGIMLVTKDLQVPIINARCGELLELPAALIEHPPSFDQIPQFQTQRREFRDVSAPEPQAELDATPTESGQFTICERKMANGSVIEVRSGHLPDGSLVQTFTDVTKRCEAEARVARLASEDPLTGLPNRRVFRSTLDQMSHRGNGAQEEEFAVLFLDLDRWS